MIQFIWGAHGTVRAQSTGAKYQYIIAILCPKILTVEIRTAGQFYQDTADIEGRGRFPGQDKYDMPVTGTSHANSSATDHEAAILADLVTNGGSFVDYRGADGADWVSVFGKENADFPMPFLPISI